MRLVATKSWIRQLRYVPFALRMVWNAAKIWTISWIILLIIQGVLPILSVFLLRDFVNRVTDLIRSDSPSGEFQPVIVIAALIGIAQIATQLIGSVLDWIRSAQSEVIRDYISDRILAKATSLDMSFFDTPEYYDQLYRVRTDARQKPLTLLENLGTLISNALTLVGMLAILAAYSPFLPVMLVIGTLPALWVIVRYSTRFNSWRLKNTPNERRSLYYELFLTERLAVSEIRLFSLGKYYRSVYRSLRQKLRHERLRINFDKLVTDLIATFIALMVAGGSLIWMGWRVALRLSTLGDLVAFYQIFQQGQILMQGLMRNSGNIYQSVLFLQDLHDFLALKSQLPVTEAVPKTRIPLRRSIRFENVSFRYPGSEKFALNHFSMTIPAGKILAIVGENGVGKTTLTKLLCRFYDPDEGRILWDDIDLRDLPLESLQREITMLFQVPYYYPESVRQNIEVGDVEAESRLSDLETAARVAGADEIIRQLPHGYDTLLGKWFGGEELSIGQWQRISLARAFYRQASLIILDEPTSAMDAWAEMKWLNRVREISPGRTLIMITHRFTTAMQADYIYLIHENQIVEEGPHESLVNQGGRYAASWSEQMRQTKHGEDNVG